LVSQQLAFISQLSLDRLVFHSLNLVRYVR